jgi:pyruvate/2-oxoglutarate dehydrogenase complex dihydrolipoamide dehydrogenase (E3) component
MRDMSADIAVIGAGAGGLSVAAGAAQLGRRVVLFELGEMGGDCLNYGCVPSKALLAAAQRAHDLRTASKFGVADAAALVDWEAVKAHIAGVIAIIAPIDSQERFEGLGCTVVRERARFTGPRTLESESVRVRASRIVIAAGGRASPPPIPGLEGYFTNETIFNAPEFPRHLVILGAGAIGMEMAQGFRRLGADVTVVEAATPLAGFDRDAADLVVAALQAEGVVFHIGARAVKAEGATLTLDTGETVSGSHILVATGRKANTDGLDLEKGGVAYTGKGVTVDSFLRSTTNRRVWAVGDIAGREQLTHAAGWHASAFVRSALFRAPTRADATLLPACVYVDPEIARIGLSESEARAHHGDRVKVSQSPFHENDRAQAERHTAGFARYVIGPGARILGATIVGKGAGDLIATVALAMANRLSLRALTGIAPAYPTRAEIVKRAASAFYAPLVFGAGARRLVSVLSRLP